MSSLDFLWVGLVNSLQPINISMTILGLVIGVVAGALPGITMLNAIVLVLPFTYAMDIVPSLLLMTGVYSGGIFGGSITGILFNIPGDPMNVPATWEGYKLNKQGHVSKALGVAVMCSALGGFLSAMVMTFVSPPFARIALSFSACEYFGVILLGLVSVVVIGTQSIGSALICLFIGMFLGTIGIDDIYGAARFSFGSRLLETGINFTVVLIGLFAIGEVLEQLCSMAPGDGDKVRGRTKTVLPGLSDLKHLWGSILRGFGVGTVIGAIPGAGATVASFVSYGMEKQFCKEPEKFGKGSWEGLSATSAAINGSTGGAMIPLLTLGIPGSGATAVMMGAFLLHGIQPGPLLFTKSPESVYTIFAGMLTCNLLMIAAGLLCAMFFAELMRVPEHIMGAFIIALSFVGAYALRNDMADVMYMAAFGIAGFFMRRFDLPIPPLVLGIILGPLAERYFLTSMIGCGNEISTFIYRPVSAALILISIAILFLPLMQKWRKRKEDSPEPI